MDRSHLHDIRICQEGVYGVRQPADQQVFPEKVHHFPVGSRIQALAGEELLPHHFNREAVKAVRQQKFLKVQREHALELNASYGD